MPTDNLFKQLIQNYQREVELLCISFMARCNLTTDEFVERYQLIVTPEEQFHITSDESQSFIFSRTIEIVPRERG